ncbi:hypothetical protein H310_04801 [Aphanomyces invadans]|uniref:DUF659 domain-containing protein n=1 Tax=Aphanomyces invadans TaxID=157072 RepID=A0A024UCD4_9STRA|nr:hypothetical protein H310_04801 [Aphanomyces invadans]ETW03298.1 hypothetical protein H310_04801 [Aphanomyces invadans]|eukprot:XP_008867527.1 hypothetical protein H310_04801 [Aphanomyces invadans]
MTAAEHSAAEELLGRAIHRNAAPFSMFDDKHWRAWLKMIRPSFRPPTREAIGGRLLCAEYDFVQTEAIRAVQAFRSICITIDGATNKASKHILNVMAAGPLAYFIEHFVMDPKRETAVNLMGKLKSVHHRLRLSMGLAQDDNADVIAVDDVPTPPEPMWNLCTDSPNVMKAFRRQALLTGLFTFAYGCLPHGLHNLCMDVNKFPVVKRIMSINVFFIVNKINAVHLLTSMFEVVCAEKHGKTYSLILFTKTRWGTGYFMLRRNLLLKSVLVQCRTPLTPMTSSRMW